MALLKLLGLIGFLTCLLFLASCSSAPRTNETEAADPTNTRSVNNSSNTSERQQADEPDDAGAKQPVTTTGNAVAKAACMTTDVGAKRAVQKGQTFALDFEPFKGTCFVTSYNPEYGDSHMETSYDVYRSGKRIFQFPSQFNGSTFGCWVDGVGFQDLNKDGLVDVIVVGKCAAKAGDYAENMVYVNTGKAFTTREDGNNKLSDLKTVKEIIAFVEDNQQIFF